MLGLIHAGLPHKALALALAAVILATSLAVAPAPASIPLIGDTESASAHVERHCETYQTLSYTSYQAQQNGSQPVWITRTRCYNVPHTHRSSWKPWVLGGIGLLGCGAIGAANAAAGYLCGGQVLAATVMSGN